MHNTERAMIHLVDDNSMIRELMTRIIESSGYSVKTFADANSYIDYTHSAAFTQPLATFVDVVMPGMSGYTMINHIHAEQPDMKFIVMSGQLDIPSDYKKLVCMFLKKPFELSRVKEILQKLSQCHACGASSMIGCATIDQRDHFNLTEWHCPKSAELQSTTPGAV